MRRRLQELKRAYSLLGGYIDRIETVLDYNESNDQQVSTTITDRAVSFLINKITKTLHDAEEFLQQIEESAFSEEDTPPAVNQRRRWREIRREATVDRLSSEMQVGVNEGILPQLNPVNRAEFDIILNTGVDPELMRLVQIEVIEKHILFPIRRDGSTLTIAMADTSNVFAIDDVKFLTGYDIETVSVPKNVIEFLIAEYKRTTQFNEVALAETLYDFVDGPFDENPEISEEEAFLLNAYREMIADQKQTEILDAVFGREEQYRRVDPDENISLDSLVTEDLNESAQTITNVIFARALRGEATEILIRLDPQEDKVLVLLSNATSPFESLSLSHELYKHIESHIRVMAQLDADGSEIVEVGELTLSIGRNQHKRFSLAIMRKSPVRQMILRLNTNEIESA